MGHHGRQSFSTEFTSIITVNSAGTKCQPVFTKMQKGKRFLEKSIATASFLVAVALAFTSIILSEQNDIAANTCLAIAQFLTLTATLLGIDYKFSTDGKQQFTAGHPQQKPAQHTQV